MRWLLGILLVGPFMAQADATVANVATPSIHADLGTSGAALELVVGGYLVAFAVLLITGARLGQTYGYRRVLVPGVGLFTLASLVCGMAPSSGVLVAARVLQGAGAALMLPQTLTGIQLEFDGDERMRAIGLYAIALSAGAVVGQILGGALISADLAGTQWRAIFLINVPVGLAVIVAALQQLPRDEPRTARRLDVPGFAGQIVRRLPARLVPWTPTTGCLLLAAAYLAISGALFAGGAGEVPLVVLLGAGGLGLGVQFSALLGHLTRVVPVEYAPDISGVSSTAMQIGGAVGVAAFGTLYLGLATQPSSSHATHAFAITTAAFAVVALVAAAGADRATRRPRVSLT